MRAALTLALGVLAVAPAGASADVRTVSFGGDLGNRYGPAELTVQAGDVVAWAGDFKVHPLRYRRSPSEPFSAPYTGRSPLRRQLAAVGDRFEYLCAIHGATGMRGLVVAGVRVDPRPPTGPPVLTVRTRPRPPIAGRPVTLIASSEFSTGNLRYTSYAWDLDGDGRVRVRRGSPDRITKRPRVTTTYAGAGLRRVAVTGSTNATGAASSSTTTFRFVVAAQADSTPPRLRVVSLRPLDLPSILRSGMTVRLRADEPVDAKIDILHEGRVLARSQRRMRAKRPTTVRLRFSSASAASLRERERVRLTLRVVARDDAGNRTTLRRTIIAR